MTAKRRGPARQLVLRFAWAACMSLLGGPPPALFLGSDGRNHATVADEGVAMTVIPWLSARDRTHGDLRYGG